MKEEQLLRDLRYLQEFFSNDKRYNAIDDLIRSIIDEKMINGASEIFRSIKMPAMNEERVEEILTINQEKMSDEDKKKHSNRMRKELGEKWNDKPPIGILPRNIWEEENKKESEIRRHDDVGKAIVRYVEADKPIKQEWINEYNDWFPVDPKEFMKPKRKRIRAWFHGETILFEVDNINKKLIQLSCDKVSVPPINDREFIQELVEYARKDGIEVEQWLRREPGAPGNEIQRHITQDILSDYACFSFVPRSPNHQEDFEKQYFEGNHTL